MESNLVSNHRCYDKNWITTQWESDLFILSMITDPIRLHKVLLPINHKSYNF